VSISIARTLYRCFEPFHKQSWTDSKITRNGPQWLSAALRASHKSHLLERFRLQYCGL